MRFIRLGAPGHERPYVALGRRVADLTPLTADIDGLFLASKPAAAIEEGLHSGLLEAQPWPQGARVGPPLARPQVICCVGMNYAAHARESGAEPPAFPVVFFKAPNTLVGPYDSVPFPRDATKLDWEVELSVVIGTRASYVESPERAREHIFGYATSNDYSERRYQLELSGGQWSKGKSFPGFNPLGPELVTADEVGPINALQLWSKVNGSVRQQGRGSDMIFAPDYLVWHISQFMALEPGDIVNTGTPAGVALSGRFPYLTEGDVVEVGVSGLGSQRTVISPTGAGANVATES